MFKGIEKRWAKLWEAPLTEIRVGDVLFTPFKTKASKFNKNFPDNLEWTKSQVKLREEISNKGYDPTNQERPVTVTKNNVCVNGHHRVTSLLEYYSEDYVITVRKLNVSNLYIIYLTIMTLIFQPKLLKSE